jgi:hypothetical protein
VFESRAGVLLIGGVAFFLFSFVSNGLVPVFMYKDLPEQKVAELINANLVFQWEDLARRFPDSFEKYYGKPTEETCAEALALGRGIYVAEGCWHCHSQFVRPVSNESRRFGPVPKTEEYQNELQRPVMFGTRRVGPDLSREGGRRSNDWHAHHFWKPQVLSTRSPMPEYPWFFDGDPTQPNKRGLAIICYVQWLGSWLESYPYYEDFQPVAGMNLSDHLPAYEPPNLNHAHDDAEDAATETATDEPAATNEETAAEAADTTDDAADEVMEEEVSEEAPAEATDDATEQENAIPESPTESPVETATESAAP